MSIYDRMNIIMALTCIVRIIIVVILIITLVLLQPNTGLPKPWMVQTFNKRYKHVRNADQCKNR